ncbi:MAG: oligopeptide transporter, OPT family [Caulobacterales bacterium 68-7]|nr:MAG: oligopeptide transporter, OPT family [Caulobacterales bacterium 68-7]
MATETSRRNELTVRGLILGVALCAIFTAANVYLGLKVGLTFASSIPAAVISMAALRAFRNANIYENNIVQTVASAAGAMSSIIFVLPGLLMVGWWTGFPFWTSFFICAIGGVLGVMYTIPLRRALVTNSNLPYPEGVAAAEVLKVGSGSRIAEGPAGAEGKAGVVVLSVTSVASALYALVVTFKVFAAEAAKFVKVGAGATGVAGSMSMALLGAGHLMGIAVGIAMFAGLVLAWGVFVPILSMHAAPADSVADLAGTVWRTQVRFIGAGAIAVASLWTLGRLAGPVIGGLTSALAASRAVKAGKGDELPITERDIPIGVVGLVCLACLAPIAVLLWTFLNGTALQSMMIPLIIAAVVYIALAGFLVAAVCGYMAGLIGSSNSPVSGMAILAVLGAALVMVGLAKTAAGPDGAPALIAFVLFVTAVLLAVAVAANDNLQDLKTGQLVNATPWKQQVGLVVGVIAGSVVIPPVLELLNKAYGFAGAANVNTITNEPLPAPQATLISTLARGVIDGGVRWDLIGIGALVGVGLVVIDEVLRRTKRFSLPPLGVGMAIYLPSAVIAPVVVGAVVGWLYDRWAEKKTHGEAAKRLGVLTASGFIVGESLFNVAYAGLIVATGKDSPLALVSESFEAIALPLGLASLIAVVLGLYYWTEKKAANLG